MARRSELARRRAAMGFSQESMAERLQVDRATVGRWERGEWTPSPTIQPTLASALQVSLDELAVLLSHASMTRASSARRSSAGELSRDSVESITVESLRKRVEQLDEQYDQVPSTSLLASAGLALGQIALFKEHAATARMGFELREIEAAAETLMGQLVWDASQRRDHVNARNHFERAVEAARLNRDDAAEGNALLRMSYLSLYGERDALAGLALTQHATQTIRNASHVLTGLALLHTAEAHAMLGDQRACEAALSQAESRFARSHAHDIAGFLYSPSQFDRMEGSCYLFLGDNSRAQAVLERTARATTRQNKSRAIVLGNLCLAHLRQGELDGATTALHEAIDVVEETRGGGGLNIVFDAGRQLRRWRSEYVVSEVYDRLLSLMTAA